MRVAMVINGYYPRIGGAERQLTALAPALGARGVAVDVVTRRFPGLAPFETIDGIPVHRVTVFGSKGTRSATFTFGAVRRMARLRPDVLHAHDLFSPTTTALLSKRMLRTPVVVKVPTGGSFGTIRRLRSRAFGRRRLAWLARRVDAFIAITREIDGELATIGVPRDRRFSIPNGVDTARFAPFHQDDKDRRREALKLTRGPVLIFTGRLEPQKRIADLLAVWPAIRERHADALLLLVGSGQQRAVLEAVAGEGVRFPGSVLDVAPYLQAADLFVLPSAAEGLPNSLLEAMSVGLPCIATAVGGCPELIDHGGNGWLVPPCEPERLGQAILALLDNPGLREDLGRRARRTVESRYSLSKVAAETHRLYRELVYRNASSSSISECAVGI